MISYKEIVEVVPKNLYWISSKEIPKDFINSVYFCTDNDLKYNPFNKDFGPLSLDKVIMFIRELEKILKINKDNKKIIYYYTSLKKEARCNSAFLIGCFMIFQLKLSSFEIWKKFSKIEPKLEKFRDTYIGNKIYDLSLLSFFRAFEYSIKLNLFDPYKFDPKNYQFYSNLKNGNLNWIIEKKILIFSPPINDLKENEYIKNSKCKSYISLFKKNKIRLIIRLNKKTYNKKIFEKQGIKHIDLYLQENTKPSTKLIIKFIKIIERTKGAIAIHSNSGLGRAALLVALSLIFIFKYSPEDSIAWLRICRPWSIIGKQKEFLVGMRKYMFKIYNNSEFVKSLKYDQRKWIENFHLCKFF